MSKYEFGIPNIFLVVKLDTDTPEWSVVFNGNRTRLFVEGNRDGCYILGVKGVTIDRIHEDLVEDFQ